MSAAADPSPAGLLDRAVALQRLRNDAALAAIEARAADIAEAEKFERWLCARGHHARVAVDTAAVGQSCFCNITLWLSSSPHEFAELQLALQQQGIATERTLLADRGQMRSYVMRLGRQELPALVNLVATREAA